VDLHWWEVFMEDKVIEEEYWRSKKYNDWFFGDL